MAKAEAEGEALRGELEEVRRALAAREEEAGALAAARAAAEEEVARQSEEARAAAARAAATAAAQAEDGRGTPLVAEEDLTNPSPNSNPNTLTLTLTRWQRRTCPHSMGRCPRRPVRACTPPPRPPTERRVLYTTDHLVWSV